MSDSKASIEPFVQVLIDELIEGYPAVRVMPAGCGVTALQVIDHLVEMLAWNLIEDSTHAGVLRALKPLAKKKLAKQIRRKKR